MSIPFHLRFDDGSVSLIAKGIEQLESVKAARRVDRQRTVGARYCLCSSPWLVRLPVLRRSFRSAALHSPIQGRTQRHGNRQFLNIILDFGCRGCGPLPVVPVRTIIVDKKTKLHAFPLITLLVLRWL